MSSVQKNSQITYTDGREKNHLDQIAKNVSEATGSEVTSKDVEPIKNQHPLPQFIHPVSEKLEEAADLMEGLQGKPRTAKASDFLKDKLNWLKKKHGSGIKLIKK